jgi:hypothetical protein
LSHAPFFRGFEHLAGRIPAVSRAEDLPEAAAQRHRPDAWYVVEVPPAARDAADRLRAVGARAPRIMLALGFSAKASKSPSACADTLLDPEVLRKTLDADESTAVQTRGADGPYRLHSLTLLNRGKGPFRFDFRWSFRAERFDRPDGAVLVRYALLSTPPPERMTAFQGAVVIVPDGAGSRVLEVLVLGSDVSLPSFLVPQATRGVKSILGIRAERLARLLR